MREYLLQFAQMRLRSMRAKGTPTSVSPPGGVRLREVNFEDCAAVSALKRRHDLKQDSPENWQRFWRNNPAIANSASRRMGWLLETEERIVGYLGSIPLLCFYRGVPLSAVTAHGLVVEPGYRTYTPALVAAYTRQTGVDLLLSTSASEASAKLFEVYKGEALPQSDYRRVLFWVIDPSAFLEAMQQKLRFNGVVGQMGRYVGAPLLRAERLLFSRHPRKGFEKYQIRTLSPSEIDCEFDDFWRKKLATVSRLVADRSAQTLRWHFAVPGDNRRPVVFRCDCNGRLVGYAVVVTRQEGLLRKLWVADILVQDEHSPVASELVFAAFEYACQTKHHVFELFGFPRSIREVCSKWNPYFRQHSAYLFKAADRDMHASLRSEDAWYATPYDGDTTLMPAYDPVQHIPTVDRVMTSV